MLAMVAATAAGWPRVRHCKLSPHRNGSCESSSNCLCHLHNGYLIQLPTKVARSFTITEKAPTIRDPNRGLLHDCEIFTNLRLTFVSSSDPYPHPRMSTLSTYLQLIDIRAMEGSGIPNHNHNSQKSKIWPKNVKNRQGKQRAVIRQK